MNSARLEEEFGKDVGLVHQMIVSGRKIGVGRLFYSRLAHNEARFRYITDIVLGTKGERLAAEILGPENVLGFHDVCRVQKFHPPAVEPIIPFSKSILRDCAEENRLGDAKWILAYVTGRSLHGEREVMGYNQKKQPCFDPDWWWWLDKPQDPWANQAVKPGYRLLDFTKRYVSTFWSDQETAISQLGGDFERAEEQAVAEICFSYFLISPDNKRLMSDFYHWGKLKTAVGLRVSAGFFLWKGFRVSSDRDDKPNDKTGVVISWKPA